MSAGKKWAKSLVLVLAVVGVLNILSLVLEASLQEKNHGLGSGLVRSSVREANGLEKGSVLVGSGELGVVSRPSNLLQDDRTSSPHGGSRTGLTRGSHADVRGIGSSWVDGNGRRLRNGRRYSWDCGGSGDVCRG